MLCIAQVVMYGTMLGGVRDSDVLPFTADVDLVVARKYWPQVPGGESCSTSLVQICLLKCCGSEESTLRCFCAFTIWL